MMHKLRAIVVFVAVVSLLAVSAEKDDKLLSGEVFDPINNGKPVNEDEEPSLDNAVDLQEGENCVIVSFLKRSRTDITVQPLAIPT